MASVELDPIFLETVTIDAANPMKVFLTLGDDCNGLFVEKAADHFVVRELAGGKSNAKFDWRLVAKRKGLEDMRLESFDPTFGGGLDPEVPHVPHAANDSTGRADTDARRTLRSASSPRGA